MEKGSGRLDVASTRDVWQKEPKDPGPSTSRDTELRKKKPTLTADLALEEEHRRRRRDFSAPADAKKFRERFTKRRNFFSESTSMLSRLRRRRRTRETTNLKLLDQKNGVTGLLTG